MLGVIADDFTGASDIASFLEENGFRTVQMNGVPQQEITEKVDAIVISLKSRSNPPEEAVSQSLEALTWLQKQGATQFYFKYCSTFDSTAKGNIGPVTDTLMQALGAKLTVIVPALPVNGRTVFNGYLFVGEQLLNESGMQNHPITPMRDANLLRLMENQAQGRAALINYSVIKQGKEKIQQALFQLQQQGYRYVVMDSINDQHLDYIAAAVSELKLLTGGSGLAGALAKYHNHTKKPHSALVPERGRSVILSGSCSLMTNKQVIDYQKKAQSKYLNVAQAINNPNYAEELAQWVLQHLEQQYAPLIYATVPPTKLAEIQQQFGAKQASQAIENTFGKLAVKLIQNGITNLIVAGGETSSIVVQTLGINGFTIGKKIAAGVPWLKVLDRPLFLALKSGNFGNEHFFSYAQEMLK